MFFFLFFFFFFFVFFCFFLFLYENEINIELCRICNAKSITKLLYLCHQGWLLSNYGVGRCGGHGQCPASRGDTVLQGYTGSTLDESNIPRQDRGTD